MGDRERVLSAQNVANQSFEAATPASDRSPGVFQMGNCSNPAVNASSNFLGLHHLGCRIGRREPLTNIWTYTTAL